MAESAYLQFLKDPDQDGRRAELRAFIGPNADTFLKAYDKLVVSANRKPGEKIKFSWFGNGLVPAAFFVGPVWYFYRKMWIWGIGIVGLIGVLSFLPTNAFNIPLGIGLAAAGRQAYLSFAIQKIVKSRATPPSESALLDRLAHEGGVSRTAAWVGGVVYALLAALAIFGIWYSVKTGQPLPR